MESAEVQQRGRAPVRMQESSRPPSYLGLSCSVSGYSPYTRYTSPDGRRSVPKQIPVSSPPQTLDSVSLVLEQQNLNKKKMRSNGGGTDVPDRAYINGTHTRKFETVSVSQTTTTTKMYSGNSREVSPLSDASLSSDGSGNGSTLVQRQIERLYGGRVTSVRTSISPETTEEKKGFFSKRLGLKQRSSDGGDSESTSPLDFKPLKVPAVFRLLRPEFREQLKNGSCQIPGEQTSPTGRLSPARKSPSPGPSSIERIIPIKREAADEQETPKRAQRVVPIKLEVEVKEEDKEEDEVKSPNLVLQQNKQLEESKEIAPEPVVVAGDSNVDDELVPYEDEEEQSIPERSLLCTIVEEDNESTASGSQVNLTSSNNNGKAVIANNNKHAAAAEVHDGHYFIKLMENEIFKFEEQICDFEEDLASAEAGKVSIPEDVRDAILAAVGKAKLLMAQKLAQFRGLCDKNITLTVEEDPFVPTPADLAGFWDMVYIQVEHIHALFAELAEIRRNGWKRKEPLSNGSSTSVKATPPSKPTPPNSGGKKKPNPANSAKSKARDEARRKMLEEKKRQMRQQKEKSANEDSGDLFVQF